MVYFKFICVVYPHSLWGTAILPFPFCEKNVLDLSVNQTVFVLLGRCHCWLLAQQRIEKGLFGWQTNNWGRRKVSFLPL